MIRLSAVPPEEAAAVARLCADHLGGSWTAETIAELLRDVGFAFLAATASVPAGCIVCRSVADECEILALAVEPSHRRRGQGRRLLHAALRAARALGARRAYLEVASDNAAATAFYFANGFQPVGRRPSYYRRSPMVAVDALILRRDLDEIACSALADDETVD